MKNQKKRRGNASKEKQNAILDAAREVFAESGLEGASLRSVANKAGYTPAALYFHFTSKEALYAALLSDSLNQLGLAVEKKAENKMAEERLYAAAMAFFNYYADHPGDLDLGFYLFRGGMKPSGLGRERDEMLNHALEAALRPIAIGAEELGASVKEANLTMVDMFAHATGLLLLLHTGRIRMFGASAQLLMERQVNNQIKILKEKYSANN